MPLLPDPDSLLTLSANGHPQERPGLIDTRAPQPPTKTLFQQTLPECLSPGQDDSSFQRRHIGVGPRAGGHSVGLGFMIPAPGQGLGAESGRGMAVGRAPSCFGSWAWGLQRVSSQHSGPQGSRLYSASPQIHPASPVPGTGVVSVPSFIGPPGHPLVGDSPASSWRHRAGERRSGTLP